MLKLSQEYKVLSYALVNLETYKPNSIKIKLRYTKLSVVHVPMNEFC